MWSDQARPLAGDERLAYLTLALTPGIGPERLRSLLETCGSATGALAAPFEFLRSVPGIGNTCATAIRSARIEQGAMAAEQTSVLGGVVLLPGDPDYPAGLLHIDSPPPALFTCGKLALLTRPCVAIVGSRDHSRYGADVCAEIASQAAAAGLVVVSGMARGLDAVAHEAALRAGGGTLGVLGNGLGVVYPAANRHLYQEVAASGLLLTEFPPGERPTAGSFPQRNRLISGLAKVTVVVEAALGSGALITADAAMEQGRDVMAIPGPVTSAKSAGTNRLIRDGAMPLLEPADLLARYPELVRSRQAPGGEEVVPPTPQGKILEVLSKGACQVDELSSVTGVPAGELLGLLAALEIGGLVRQEPGLMFARARASFGGGKV
jgi:DNA processing protein